VLVRRCCGNGRKRVLVSGCRLWPRGVGDRERLMPLVMERCSSEAAPERLRAASSPRLFAGARAPEAALSGLYVYFSCFEEAHPRGHLAG
jgi:hypothetical protein